MQEKCLPFSVLQAVNRREYVAWPSPASLSSGLKQKVTHCLGIPSQSRREGKVKKNRKGRRGRGRVYCN